MSKLKLVAQCLLMGSGVFMLLSGLPASEGAVIAMGGFMFGLGLHWYRKGFGVKAFVTGALAAMLAPVVAGAVAMGQPLLWLVAFVLFGGVYHMVKKSNPVI